MKKLQLAIRGVLRFCCGGVWKGQLLGMWIQPEATNPKGKHQKHKTHSQPTRPKGRSARRTETTRRDIWVQARAEGHEKKCTLWHNLQGQTETNRGNL